MKLLRSIYYFFIYTNVLIAGAAVAQCAVTYLFFNAPFDYPIMMVEGAATLLLYNFSMFLSKPAEPQKSLYKRTRWVFRNEWLLWGNSTIAIGTLVYAVCHIHFYSLIFLMLIGLISLVYSLPILRYKGKRSGFRQLPGIKVFHIAFVWTLSSVCLPVLEMHLDGTSVNLTLFKTLFLLKFIFLLICTLPFDIRDIKQDSYYHLKTIPSMIGANRSIALCYGLLIIHSLIIVFSDIFFQVQMGILTTNLFIAVVLKCIVFRNTSNYHYAFLLDFALIAQFFIVYLFL